MASEENHLPESSSTSILKTKRPRKSSMIPIESGQRCIASAMSKVVNNMVNKQLQQRCKELLQVEDVKNAEARILWILQQIDNERENEKYLKENAKKRKINLKASDR